MTYNLSELNFINDFCYLELSDGSTVVFNLVDEQLAVGSEELIVNAINIAVVDSNGNYADGVNVIGEGNDFYMLLSDYKDCLGKPLDKDNIKYCTLEVSDD